MRELLLDQLATFTAMGVGILGAYFAYIKLVMESQGSKIRQFELFLKLQKLCDKDARDNLAAIRVGLNSYTKRELTPKEIEWFVYTPSAFSYLKSYGRQTRYVSIDTDLNRFVYKSNVDSRIKRFKESGTLLFLYVVFGTAGAFLVDTNPPLLESGKVNPWVPLFAGGLLLLYFAGLMLYVLLKLIDAHELVGSHLPED